jgi:UDPglucose 6-dehydrogenase
MSYKFGIVGYGFVGQALHGSVKEDVQVVLHDPPKGLHAKGKELEGCNIIFLCLPTPTVDGKQHAFLVNDMLAQLYKMNFFHTVAVIKSTVLWENVHVPHPTDNFGVVANPEFLSANSAHEDFRSQRTIVLGGRKDHCMEVARAYRECFNFMFDPQFVFCTPEEASALKYCHNVKHALNVLFWNYVHETFGNQRKIADMYNVLSTAGADMQRIFADGKAGFGGACFPKDVAAIHGASPHELTRMMLEYNRRLRGEE